MDMNQGPSWVLLMKKTEVENLVILSLKTDSFFQKAASCFIRFLFPTLANSCLI
jgi:hypothetical protein